MKKRTSKLTIGIILTLSSLFVVLIFIGTIFVFKHAYQEILLEDSINEINDLIDYDINNANIDRLLDTYVSSGEYLKVEKAVKEYFSDLLFYCRRVDDLGNDLDLIMVLSLDNFYVDMPNFNDSLNILEEKKIEITEAFENVSKLLDKTVINSYLDPSLSQFYVEYYNSLLSTDEELFENQNAINTDLNFISNVIDLYHDFFTFLKVNQDYWMVDREYIYFANTDLENEYNYYLNQMENISREDFDFTEDFI